MNQIKSSVNKIYSRKMATICKLRVTYNDSDCIEVRINNALFFCSAMYTGSHY